MWQYFQKYELIENKRLNCNNNDYQNWLLKIGNGSFNNESEKFNEVIEIPPEMLSTTDIISDIYGFGKIKLNDKSIINNIILAPTNAEVNEINNTMLYIQNRR